MEKWGPHKSSIFDLDANVAAMIAYGISILILFFPGIKFMAWLLPLIFYFVEKKSDFVRFHSMQAVILNVTGLIINVIFGIVAGGNLITTLFRPSAWPSVVSVLILNWIISIVIIIFEVICMVKSYGYEEYHIPIIGEWTDKMVKKI